LNPQLLDRRADRHREPADQIGNDRHRFVAEPVNYHAAEDTGDECRQHLGESDQSGLRRAPGRLQHEPGQRHDHERVADQGDDIAGEQRS